VAKAEQIPHSFRTRLDDLKNLRCARAAAYP
jgi:hypothetical protein